MKFADSPDQMKKIQTEFLDYKKQKSVMFDRNSQLKKDSRQSNDDSFEISSPMISRQSTMKICKKKTIKEAMTQMKSAINWEALMDRIKDVEGIEDDLKYKRLHLFLTEENIERADAILKNAKQGEITDNKFH